MSIKLFILEQSRLATAGKRFFLSKASKRNLRTRQFVDNISKQNFCFDEEFFAGNNWKAKKTVDDLIKFFGERLKILWAVNWNNEAIIFGRVSILLKRKKVSALLDGNEKNWI